MLWDISHTRISLAPVEDHSPFGLANNCSIGAQDDSHFGYPTIGQLLDQSEANNSVKDRYINAWKDKSSYWKSSPRGAADQKFF